MPIQIEHTTLFCTFCKMDGKKTSLIRSMHGLYCENEQCYSRVTSGNLVPPSICEKCGENTFYFEKDGVLENAGYQCIACGFQEDVT